MGIIQDNLYKKALRDRKHLMLFRKNGVGIDKIKLVSYSATEISNKVKSNISFNYSENEKDSDDNGYNEYGGYNGGYYYRNGRYERKVSPMMNPIISPIII